jgi:hypothetical protein
VDRTTIAIQSITAGFNDVNIPYRLGQYITIEYYIKIKGIAVCGYTL